MAKQRRPRTASASALDAWIREQPKAEQSAYRKIAFLARSREPASLRSSYELGQLLLVVYPLGHRSKRYGKDFMGWLTRKLAGKKDSPLLHRLYLARKLAATLGENELEDLATQIDGSRNGFTLRHVTYLLSVADAGVRKSLCSKCLRQGWSAERLKQEIQKTRPLRRSGGGHQPAPPENTGLAVAVRDVVRLSRRWIAYSKTWVRDGRGALEQEPFDEHVEMLQVEVPAALTQIGELQKAALEVKQTLVHLTTRLGERPGDRQPHEDSEADEATLLGGWGGA
jgi:hypothetical protein